MFELLVVCGVVIFSAAVGALGLGVLIRKTSVITKIDYNIDLIGEGGVVKTIGTFSKYYWSTKSADKDIDDLCLESASIRGGNVPLDSIIMRNIKVNYEVDYTIIFLSHQAYTVKPT